MNEKYHPEKIEKYWQGRWEKEKIFKVEEEKKKEKYYLLIEFPYPSSDGLHVGHPRSYTAIDIMARKKRMEGFNVLFPIGFDAFGLPTENYALRMKRNPRDITKENIEIFRRQLKSLGFSFDWDRQVITSDPKYYKWTQWIFLKLFKAGLVYQKEMPINWCPSCKIGLANEEVIQGKCERCGTEVSKKNLKQWLFRITKYAERLLNDLDKVDYLEKIKLGQINWIGKSEGADIKFQISNSKSQIPNPKHFIEVFTTRPDTLFGTTYMVLSPEHELIEKLKEYIENFDEVKKYIEKAQAKSDLERTESKEKTGIELKGIKAINPVNKEEIPIFVADYILISYGTGAIMAVPAHDERDWEFAKKFKLPIIKVIKPPEVMFHPADRAAGIWGTIDKDIESECWLGEGKTMNSGKYDDLDSKKGGEKIVMDLAGKNLAKKSVKYKLRDWIFSRQHYWGEPIPLIHCDKCGVVLVPEKDLPLELPEVLEYEPSETGESPLAKIKDWVNVKCPKCKGKAKRETDTMPNWAGSNWYFIRYCDPKNDKEFASKDKMKYWLPVDLYNGGMEHTTLHLLYSRFWYKALYDLKLVPTSEPYNKRVSHGMVLAEDGKKMSKSFGNVINPDDVVKEYGADTMRMYEMFMGPFDQSVNWNTKSIKGISRFLDRVWKVLNNIINKKGELKNVKGMSALIHKTIKKVSEDIENLRFNTAISALMIYFNERDFAMKLNAHGELEGNEVDLEALEKYIILLSPFTPHLAEELWQKLDHKDFIINEKWPAYDEKMVKEEEVEFIIQVNGKLRDRIKMPVDISESEAKEKALASEKIKKYVTKDPEKVIFIKGRLINFVV